MINRASTRCASGDYLPVAGPLEKMDDYIGQFGRLSFDASQQLPLETKAGTRVFMLGALGSQGFISAPLLAESISAELLEQPSILPESFRQAISPQRFLLRNIIRGRLRV